MILLLFELQCHCKLQGGLAKWDDGREPQNFSPSIIVIVYLLFCRVFYTKETL